MVSDEVHKRRVWNATVGDASKLQDCSHKARSWVHSQMDRNHEIIMDLERHSNQGGEDQCHD